MKQTDFIRQMDRLAKSFGKTYDQNVLNIMYAKVKYFPLAAHIAAVDSLIIEERYLPKFRELHGAMRTALDARGLKLEKPDEVVQHKCSWCEDSGIRLRRNRRDMVRDFYCACPAAKALTHYDWSDPLWKETITGFEHLPERSARTRIRTLALARAARTLRPVVDVATGEPFTLEDIPF